nr:hypothetical protein [uncultured Cupriavidus sp.]
MEFLTNLVKRPLQLLLLCMVLYLASKSFVVGLFVAIVGVSFLYSKAVSFNRSVPAAPKVSMPDYPSKSKPQTPQPEEQPEQQYERSAVVTPIRRTGTHDHS